MLVFLLGKWVSKKVQAVHFLGLENDRIDPVTFVDHVVGTFHEDSVSPSQCLSLAYFVVSLESVVVPSAVASRVRCVDFLATVELLDVDQFEMNHVLA